MRDEGKEGGNGVKLEKEKMKEGRREGRNEGKLKKEKKKRDG